MTEATPRPWAKFKQHGGWSLEDKHGFPVAFELGDADAALIIKAVNRDHLFDELVGTLKTSRAALDDLLKQIPTDERVADYNFDFAETADIEAEAVLTRVAEQEKA